MNLSYWEYKTWLSNIDFTIVGSGIVGLNCALALKTKYSQAKVLVLEKGVLPQGASTKNAGFACYGSISEILADLERHSEQEVKELVQQRWEGVKLLRESLGDKNIEFKELGGHELFLEADSSLYEKALSKIAEVNALLAPVFGDNAFHRHENTFKFEKIKEEYITNRFEGQINTGKMMLHLLKLVQNSDIIVLNAVAVQEFTENGTGVVVKTNEFEFRTKKLFIATNGFANQLLNEKVVPGRAQVLITKPIADLAIKGTFHLEEGYYYFRDIDNRILLGGGRNLDFKGEETEVFGETDRIQNQLETILRKTILPNIDVEIERRWSGIMGVGEQKKPILKQISNHVFCGVRLGGMGIAIGSKIGADLANLA